MVPSQNGVPRKEPVFGSRKKFCPFKDEANLCGETDYRRDTVSVVRNVKRSHLDLRQKTSG